MIHKMMRENKNEIIFLFEVHLPLMLTFFTRKFLYMKFLKFHLLGAENQKQPTDSTNDINFSRTVTFYYLLQKTLSNSKASKKSFLFFNSVHHITCSCKHPGTTAT